MPTREQNRRLWSRYDWTHSGEEWSTRWGGTALLWEACILPRIAAFLGPSVRAVEIAPGYGRITAHLAPLCATLILVDLVPNCIEHCRKRFEGATNISFFVNDGRGLSFVETGSIDFVFSFDSLVHADADTIHGYVSEIDRVLAPGGRAVIHHSNLGSVLAVQEDSRGIDRHMRAPDVDANVVAEMTQGLPHLHCCLQELLAWDESGALIDCLSVFVRHDGLNVRRPPLRVTNTRFFSDARWLAEVSDHYRCAATP